MSADEGYKQALKLARAHYENFPVVSFFLPKEIRKDIAIIYWFARTADDFADEGTGGVRERISLLDFFETGVAVYDEVDKQNPQSMVKVIGTALGLKKLIS